MGSKADLALVSRCYCHKPRLVDPNLVSLECWIISTTSFYNGIFISHGRIVQT